MFLATFLFFSFKSLRLYECNHGCPQKQSLSLVVFTLEQSFEKEFSLDYAVLSKITYCFHNNEEDKQHFSYMDNQMHLIN